MKAIESQTTRIKAHLRSGKSITALDALHLFGTFRLGARIHDLKQQGMHIKSEMIEITSGGKAKRVARYSQVKNTL